MAQTTPFIIRVLRVGVLLRQRIINSLLKWYDQNLLKLDCITIIIRFLITNKNTSIRPDSFIKFDLPW